MREHVVGQDFGYSRTGGLPTKAPDMRIIGVEVRYRHPFGQVEELALFPLDVLIPDGLLPQMQGQTMTITVHTNAGDRNGEIRL